jgi:phospholipid transport system substrate-binding protein
MKRKKSVMTWGLAGILLLPGLVHAGEATEAVRAVLDRAMAVQANPATQGPEHRSERARQIHRLIADSFLGGDMARASLHDHWQKLTKPQQEEFQNLFVDLFQDSYTRMVLNYLRQETIEYQGEDTGHTATRVKTKIMRVNEHIPVIYQVVRRGPGWGIVDVEIDGVSIVRNYRSAFQRVIVSQSVEALLKKMRVQSQAVKESATS